MEKNRSAWSGAGVTILSGVTIVVGNPAKVMREVKPGEDREHI